MCSYAVVLLEPLNMLCFCFHPIFGINQIKIRFLSNKNVYKKSIFWIFKYRIASFLSGNAVQCFFKLK